MLFFLNLSFTFVIQARVGIFEMDYDIEVENDFSMALHMGKDTLKKYGMHEKDATLVLLFMAKVFLKYPYIYL